MIFSTINNRELATYIWILLFVALCLCIPSIRKGVPGLLKIIMSKQILIPILLMVIYVVATIYLLYKIHFWDTGLLKTTIAWFIGVAFVMFFKANNAIKNPYHIKEIISDNIKLTIIMEFIINFYVFSFPVELLILPSITFLFLLKLVSERDEKNQIVTKFVSSTLSIFGLIIITYAGYELIVNIKKFSSIENLKDFLLPIMLTFIYIPFIYALILYMIYEEFFVRMKMAFRHDERLGRYARKKVLEYGRFSLSRARILVKELHIFNINSKKELDEAIKELNNTNT